MCNAPSAHLSPRRLRPRHNCDGSSSRLCVITRLHRHICLHGQWRVTCGSAVPALWPCSGLAHRECPKVSAGRTARARTPVSNGCLSLMARSRDIDQEPEPRRALVEEWLLRGTNTRLWLGNRSPLASTQRRFAPGSRPRGRGDRWGTDGQSAIAAPVVRPRVCLPDGRCVVLQVP